MVRFMRRNAAVLRAITVITVVGTLVTSVTYASLQSPTATLTGNSIQSATANLLVGTASATSTAFSASHSGFTFSGAVPGGPAVPATGNIFYLKNTGTTTLNLKLVATGTPLNPANIDLTKVSVVVTRVDSGATQTTSLQTLLNSGLALTDTLIPASNGVQYTISVQLATDAFDGSGSGATVGPFDFVFSGTAVAS